MKFKCYSLIYWQWHVRLSLLYVCLQRSWRKENLNVDAVIVLTSYYNLINIKNVSLFCQQYYVVLISLYWRWVYFKNIMTLRKHMHKYIKLYSSNICRYYFTKNLYVNYELYNCISTKHSKFKWAAITSEKIPNKWNNDPCFYCNLQYFVHNVGYHQHTDILLISTLFSSEATL